MTSHVEAALRGYLVGHKHELLFVNGRGRPYSRNKIVQTILYPALDALGIRRKGAELVYTLSGTRSAAFCWMWQRQPWRNVSCAIQVLLPHWESTGTSSEILIETQWNGPNRYFPVQHRFKALSKCCKQ